jgi:S1-C subfamily serine protease
MRAPKRLWSGNWQQESAALSEELAELRARPADPKPVPAPPRRELATPRPRPGRALPVALALATILMLAAGAYGLTAVLGSQNQSTAANTGQSGQSTQPSRPIHWLGMQIESVPPQSVVIETVGLGSQAAAAGLEPGDVIVDVNGRPVSATGDIGRSIAGLHAGDPVEIHVNRGSTRITTQLSLATPPSSHP